MIIRLVPCVYFVYLNIVMEIVVHFRRHGNLQHLRLSGECTYPWWSASDTTGLELINIYHKSMRTLFAIMTVLINVMMEIFKMTQHVDVNTDTRISVDTLTDFHSPQ